MFQVVAVLVEQNARYSRLNKTETLSAIFAVLTKRNEGIHTCLMSNKRGGRVTFAGLYNRKLRAFCIFARTCVTQRSSKREMKSAESECNCLSRKEIAKLKRKAEKRKNKVYYEQNR